MKSSQQPFWLLATLFVSLILLHNTAIAKPLPHSFFTFLENTRFLTVDLSELTKADRQVEKLRDFIIQKPANSKLRNQDLFLVTYLFALQENFPRARHYAKQIKGDLLISNMAHYYILHFWARSNQYLEEPLQNIAAHKQELLSRMQNLPLALDASALSTLDFFTLLELSKTNTHEMNLHFIDQLIETFQRAQVPDSTKTTLLVAIQPRIQKLHPEIQKLFYTKLHAKWPDSKSIQQMLPQSTITESNQSKQAVQAIELKQAQQWLAEAKSLLKKGQNKAAVKLWVRLFQSYPHTPSYDQAGLQLRSFLRKQKTNDPNFHDYIQHLSHLPPDMLYSEGRYLWNARQNKAAHILFTTFSKKYPYHAKASNALYILASIHETWGEFSKAKDHYRALTQEHTTSKFYKQSLFKVGLLSYIVKDYMAAQKAFENNLEMPQSILSKAQGHYWLYKTFLARKNKPQARKQSNIILKDFSFTYYATILKQHPKIEKATPTFAANKKPISLQLAQGAHLFLQLGLYNLAKASSAGISNQGNVQDQYQLAQDFNHLGMHLQSMNLMYKLLLSQKKLPTEVLQLFFPLSPYKNYFDTTQKLEVPAVVLLSIMKQESAFNPMAVSAANAQGLLQLIMPTAQNMASQNNIKINKWDLFTPSINILLGTTYITKNLKRFNQNLIDTFIAYNAGPSRAKRWKNQWENLSNDIYIEMIPIQETRTYAKLILRNIYFYQRLYPEHFNQMLVFKGLPEHFVK